jgi:pimeloyl-[acyl-carrier protein] synthase
MSGYLWKPLDEENIRNPYAMYAALRRNDPVHQAQTGEFIITRYEDIKNILKDPSFKSGNRLMWLKKGIQYFNSKQEDFRAIYRAMNSFILMLNDEKHLRIRNFIARAWNDRDVDPLIEKNIHTVLRRMPDKEVDVVAHFAQPLPVLTIAGILGAPVTDYQHLIQLGVAMTKTLDLYVSMKDLVVMNDAAKLFINYFREQVKLKNDKADDGLFSKLIQKNRQENAGLTEEELISIGIFLFTAGEETSAGLISNTLLHLAGNPAQLALLRQNPEQMDSAIDEVLRYDSVVQLLGRTASRDIVIRDKRIKSGSAITLVIGSGNRDEEAFEQADEFIISRKPNRHLSFGSGVHYCLGDWLGRRQSQLAVSAFLKQYPNITLPPQQLSWYKNIAVRRLDALRISV